MIVLLSSSETKYGLGTILRFKSSEVMYGYESNGDYWVLRGDTTYIGYDLVLVKGEVIDIIKES